MLINKLCNRFGLIASAKVLKKTKTAKKKSLKVKGVKKV